MAEPGFSGRDLGRRLVAGMRAYVSRAIVGVHAQLAEHERQFVELRAAVNNTPTMEIMRGEIAEIRNAPTEAPQPVSSADLMAMVESHHARWALEWERSADAKLERAVDRIPRPRDGLDGKDGVDGKDGQDGS